MKFIGEEPRSDLLARSIGLVSRKLANRTLMTLLESLNSGSRVAVSKVKGLESGFIVQLYQKHAITGLLFETKKRERKRDEQGNQAAQIVGYVVGRVILQMFDRKPALGRLQTCFCNVEPRILASRGIVFFFSFPYRDDRKFRPPLHKITSRQNIASISHQIPNSRPTRFHFPFSRNEKHREPPPTSTDQP